MGTSKSCGVRVVKEKETFIGHCSKFISGQGWTVEIPKIDIEEKGYLKLKDGFIVTQIEEIDFNNIKYTPQTVNMSRNTFDVILERKEKLTAKYIAEQGQMFFDSYEDKNKAWEDFLKSIKSHYDL